MMSLDHSRLLQWLRMELYKEHKAGPVSHFSIRHIANGKLGSEILELSIGESLDDCWLTTAVSEIETHVEMDAGGLGGMQAYCLLTYRGSDHDHSTGRHTFRISVEDEIGEELIQSEPANKSGLVAQCMRHTEVMMRNTTVAIGQVISNQARTIDRLATENDSLQKNQSRVYQLLEELQSHRHEREIEIRKVELKERMTEGIVDKVALLLPAVVNRAVGKTVLPEQTTPLVETIKQFMTSLSDEQMMKLIPVLTPEQRIALGMVVESFQSKTGNGAEEHQ